MSAQNVLTRFAQDLLLQRFAPVVYLNSAETSYPSSTDWYLQCTTLVDGAGNVISNPTVNNLAALGLAQSDCRLELNDKKYRVGQGTAAPMYGHVRTLGDPLTAIDLTYWFFYPFNGNVFDKDKMLAVLEVGLAAGVAMALNPFTALVGIADIVIISGVIDNIRKAQGFFLHEGDWEHVTVHLSSDKTTILGIYYAAHDGGRWYMQPAHGNREGYQLNAEGRPIVYSAKQSHASYPYAGTTTRHGGFGNDYTDKGTEWNTAGTIINITPGSFTADWLAYRGRWGKKRTAKVSMAQLFNEDVREYEDGPIGPAVKDSWINGDPDQPPLPNPQPAVRIDVIERCDGPIAVTGYRGFLWVVYLFKSPMTNNPDAYAMGVATFNGKNWEDHTGLRIANASKDQIALAAFHDELHLVFQSRNTLKWFTLALDDADRLPGAWSDKTDSGFIQGGGQPTLATSINKMGLSFELEGRYLCFAEFDGSRWTTGPNITNDFRRVSSALGVFNAQFCYGTMTSYQLSKNEGKQAALAICYVDTQNTSLSMATMVKAGNVIDDQNRFAFAEMDGALHVVFSRASGNGGMTIDWARFIEQGAERSTPYQTGHVVQSDLNIAGLGLGSMAVRDTLWAVFSKQATKDENGSVWVVPMPCH